MGSLGRWCEIILLEDRLYLLVCFLGFSFVFNFILLSNASKNSPQKLAAKARRKTRRKRKCSGGSTYKLNEESKRTAVPGTYYKVKLLKETAIQFLTNRFLESANEKVDVIYDGRGNWYKKMSPSDISPEVQQYYNGLTPVSPSNTKHHLYNPNSRTQQELENNVESYVATFPNNPPTYDRLYKYAMSHFKAIHEYFSNSSNPDTSVNHLQTGHGFTVDPSNTWGTVYVPRTVDQHTEYTTHKFSVSEKPGRDSRIHVEYTPSLGQDYFFYNQAQVILALLAYLRLMNNKKFYQ